MRIITERFAVGQNAAKSSSSGENTSSLESLIFLWYDEVAKFSKYDVEKYE